MGKRQRVLVKLRGAALKPGFPLAAGDSVELTPLFDAEVESGPGMAPSVSTRWFLAESEQQTENPWDGAHLLLQAGLGFAAGEAMLAEPDLLQDWLPEQPTHGLSATDEDDSVPRPQFRDERPPGPAAHWHLGDSFSGLKAARETAGGGAGITIAHLDTGYDPKHSTLPRNLDTKAQRNFIDRDRGSDASDRTPNHGFLKNRGHGTGTLGILAGNAIHLTSASENLLEGEALGGAPDARIIPVRVANSVVQFYTSSVASGIDYAREQGAHVLSMSLGGVASNAWADAVNRAYDEGVVLVTAAGNNFMRLPTSFIVYPARFRRVVAACGVMADGRPYWGLSVMQGNHGPRTKMGTAVSAHTPNISWARLGSPDIVDFCGQGTSAATPQVAAAAALYFAKHKTALAKMPGWMRVEAVRNALYNSSKRPSGMAAADAIELLGQGIVHARDALSVLPEAAESSRQSRDDASFAFLRGVLGLGVAADDSRASMLRLEMTQLALKSRDVAEAVEDPDVEASQVPEPQRRRFFEALIDQSASSRTLRTFLEQRLTRRPVRESEGPPAPPPGGSAAAFAGRGRRISDIVPPARRLRIFALDPTLGTSLSTAFLNETIVEVPWERTRANANLLTPGPVGEYLEVVDVDPASGAAYAPVDLNNPMLLAQDGLPPSEGNPQFHQQMVYAVAMRTIRHFETALGRVALWAPQKLPGRKDTAFVRRLRVYPHALRQANAFYSPDKKALLFGYFPVTASTTSGADSAVVFTCLSHDVIAHETTHALLDGIHPRLREVSNRDVRAFHEAFADIVAIFQHFTFGDLLKHELQEAQGKLRFAARLAELARQFGQALGRSTALRCAIDASETQKRVLSDDMTEPHERGAILVAAVFDAFLAIYNRRTADLFRMVDGRMSTELIERLADEAVKTAHHILTICVRAIDYLPPVDVTFGDYLRALITADLDLVPSDKLGYRVAFLEAFRNRHIYLDGVRTYSVESACWRPPRTQPPGLGKLIEQLDLGWDLSADRERAWALARSNAARVNKWLKTSLNKEVAWHLGLNLELPIEVHSVRPARRVAPNGSFSTDLVIVATQRKGIDLDGEVVKPAKIESKEVQGFKFRGGCTMLVDATRGQERVRCAVVKHIDSAKRLATERKFRAENSSLASLYFEQTEESEPFALGHLGH